MGWGVGLGGVGRVWCLWAAWGIERGLAWWGGGVEGSSRDDKPEQSAFKAQHADKLAA